MIDNVYTVVIYVKNYLLEDYSSNKYFMSTDYVPGNMCKWCGNKKNTIPSSKEFTIMCRKYTTSYFNYLISDFSLP